MKLIINADDFGLCKSVNDAIVKCFESGNLTNTTLMVNQRGTEQAAALSKSRPGLGIGLHFCLTEGRPLTDCHSLVDSQGEFFDRTALLMRAYRGKIHVEELQTEFEAQLNRAQDLGIHLTHIDSHQHAHLIPQIFDGILPIVRKHRLPLRNGLSLTNKKLMYKNPVKFIKQSILKRSAVKLRKTYSYTPEYTVSIHDFPQMEREPNIYYRILGILSKAVQPDSIVELMVHPYIEDAELGSLYPTDYASRHVFFENCYSEFSFLSKARLDWESNNAELTSYGELNE